MRTPIFVTLLFISACQASTVAPIASPSGPSPTVTPLPSPQPTTQPAPEPSATPNPEVTPEIQPSIQPSTRPMPTPNGVPTPTHQPSAWPTNLQPQGPVKTPLPLPVPDTQDCQISVSAEFDDHIQPVWSPDGTWLSYHNARGSVVYQGNPFCGEGGSRYTSAALNFLHLKTGAEVVYTSGVQEVNPIGWGADQRFYFLQAETNGSFTYVHSFSPLDEGVQKDLTHALLGRSHSLDPERQRLGLWGRLNVEQNHFPLLQYNLAADKGIRWTELAQIPRDNRVESMEWLEEGLLVNLSDYTTDTWSLRLVSAEQNTLWWQQPVLPQPQTIQSVTRSPDGLRIAIVTSKKTLNSKQSGVYDQQHLYLGDLVAGELKNLHRVSGLQRVGAALSWSPDSQQIVVSEGTGESTEPLNESLWVLTVRDESLRLLLQAEPEKYPVYHRMPAWSPDKAWIAFSSNQKADFENDLRRRHAIFRIRPDGQGLQQLSFSTYTQTP